MEPIAFPHPVHLHVAITANGFGAVLRSATELDLPATRAAEAAGLIAGLLAASS